MNKTSKLTYNNLSRLFLMLEPSIAYISDFKNWNSFEDENIIKLKDEAKKNNLKSVLFVPLKNELLDGLWNKENIFKKAESIGVDSVYFYIANNFLEEMTDEELFLNIKKDMNIQKILVADNYTDPTFNGFITKFFINMWKENCITFNNYSKKESNDKLYSYLKNSELDLFEEMTNLKYSFTGRVVEGKKIGRTIGFPTINLLVDNKLSLTYGVYAVKVLHVYNNEEFLGAACYWTNENQQDVFEINLFNFDKDIYGQEVVVYPIQKIRNNKKFDNINKLKETLEEDVKLIKENF